MNWGKERPPNYVGEREWLLQSPKSGLYVQVPLHEEHDEITRRAMAEIAEALNDLRQMSNKKPEMSNKKPELSKKEQKVWQFLTNNPKASTYETSLTCGVDVLFVENVASRMAAWAGADNGAGEWNAGPADILTSYPDDNPKTCLLYTSPSPRDS